MVLSALLVSGLLLDIGLRQEPAIEQDAIDVSRQLQTMRIIEQRMGEVAVALDREETGEAMQSTQRAILDELDRLIFDAENSPSQPAPNDASQNPGREDPGSAGNRPNEGNTGTGAGAGEGIDGIAQARERLLESAWGHLPDRMRAELASSLGERFLPGYEKLIELYYKRLANLDENDP